MKVCRNVHIHNHMCNVILFCLYTMLFTVKPKKKLPQAIHIYNGHGCVSVTHNWRVSLVLGHLPFSPLKTRVVMGVVNLFVLPHHVVDTRVRIDERAEH